MSSHLRWSRIGAPLLIALAGCLGEAPASELALGEESSELSRPILPGKIVVTPLTDPLGIEKLGALEAKLFIRSPREYQALLGHLPPVDVKFTPNDGVLLYSAGEQLTGGFKASISSVHQLGRSLNVLSELVVPGENCDVADALTVPYALATVHSNLPLGFVGSWPVRRSVDACEVLDCKGVECRVGSHCELVDVQCVSAPCDPIPTCVADEVVSCGGVAVFPCPGAGTCEENTHDDCDPLQGGSDCSGICACPEIAYCVIGTWNPSPEVCACEGGRPRPRPRTAP